MIEDALGAAQLIALEPVGPDRLRSALNQDNRAGMIFGGQPLCQALAAACTTVADWPAHSLSAMFLRGGVVAEPVDYQVERSRDGRRFAQRRVLATQGGRPIFDLLCSFHDPEDGGAYQMGDVEGVPAPETLPSLRDYVLGHADRLPKVLVHSARLPFPVEIRLIDPDAILLGTMELRQRDHWFRMPSAAGIAAGHAHQCLLAFASDYWLAGTASAGRRVHVASLNHSLWFHAPMNAGDWLLYRTDSPWAGQGRGLARGLIYDRSGVLVASVAQEISARARPHRRDDQGAAAVGAERDLG
ncbi:acyl-CoA thioesterase [Sphingomonas bacterium]|uniref:acyl-CoA thioesterase n=1 Tax=Sphingomonas bacterium TaxID=1895847 RepID=UPI001575FFAF|nr:acyl-CoA thioesterase domain-containing protein [Sphingomonas bacterium]